MVASKRRRPAEHPPPVPVVGVLRELVLPFIQQEGLRVLVSLAFSELHVANEEMLSRHLKRIALHQELLTFHAGLNDLTDFRSPGMNRWVDRPLTRGQCKHLFERVLRSRMGLLQAVAHMELLHEHRLAHTLLAPADPGFHAQWLHDDIPSFLREEVVLPSPDED